MRLPEPEHEPIPIVDAVDYETSLGKRVIQFGIGAAATVAGVYFIESAVDSVNPLHAVTGLVLGGIGIKVAGNAIPNRGNEAPNNPVDTEPETP